MEIKETLQEKQKRELELEKTLERADKKYTASNIMVLEGLEAVRKRPSMYIGSTSSTGLHHLVWEIVDNAVDEALAGYCTQIEVTINADNTITVIDDGRGIPTDIVTKTGKSALETVFTILHAGGKFGEGGGYKVSGGLHGVGASVVNALSEWMEVNVYRDGFEHHIRFENGGKCAQPTALVGPTDKNGTKVTFKPDPTIFTETTEFNYETIRDRLKQMAFLNRGVKIIISDKRVTPELGETFFFEGGIIEYVRFLNKNKVPSFDEVIYCEGREDGIFVEVAMQYNEGFSPNGYSFCNNIHTHEGGTHEEGFRLAITRVMNNYA
ncbi:MAG TPA: DNA topoisomerase IV subunit B, partial [Firmicutes bacterium]|nr:DNA topoisomerase IV subunit B [Bacillota bacterium]